MIDNIESVIQNRSMSNLYQDDHMLGRLLLSLSLSLSLSEESKLSNVRKLRKDPERERERDGHRSTRCRVWKVHSYGAVGPLGLLKRLSYGLALFFGPTSIGCSMTMRNQNISQNLFFFFG